MVEIIVVCSLLVLRARAREEDEGGTCIATSEGGCDNKVHLLDKGKKRRPP